MTKSNPSKLLLLFLFGAVAAMGASAQTFKTLVRFNGDNGAFPRSALTQGPDGRLYGTTTSGALQSNGWGTLFATDASGHLTTLVNFDNGLKGAGTINSPLLLTPDGTFFGASPQAFYELTGNGKLKVDAQYPPGADAGGPVAEGIDGDIYGVTLEGGDPDCGEVGCGTAYKIDRKGHDDLLVTFGDGNNSLFPVGATLGDDGYIYLITGSQADDVYGQVLRMTPTGALATLYDFCSQPNCADGDVPFDLIQGSDGNLYGVTYLGGTCGGNFILDQGCGTVFRLSLSGEYTVLHTFCTETPCSDGAEPVWLIEGSDGALYGITQYYGDLDCQHPYGCGTIFRVTKSGVFTSLYQFHPGDGLLPRGLTQATTGLFYGVQYWDLGVGCSLTEYWGCGTVFSLNIGLPPFVSVVQGFGKPGVSDSIIGQGFTGATEVAFNGIPATFTVVSDTFLETTIPQGATTGYVTVTTPSGVLKSNVPFHVIK